MTHEERKASETAHACYVDAVAQQIIRPQQRLLDLLHDRAAMIKGDIKDVAAVAAFNVAVLRIALRLHKD